MLCDDLEGWGGHVEEKHKRERIYADVWLIHTVAHRKLMQLCVVS